MIRLMSKLAVGCLAALLVQMPASHAADFPTKPVQIIVGFGPGGGVDLFARRVAQKLTEKWGQPVVVVNKPGASAQLAADYVAHSAPNGYTLVMVSNAFSVKPQNPTYDPVDSFAPITLAGSNAVILLVHPSVPANNLKDLIALAKAKPGTLNFGNPGVGGPPFMANETLIKRAGIDAVTVPFDGGGPALVSLLGGETQVLFSPISGAAELVKAGKVRALAVSTAQRSPSMPDLPTVAEAADLPGFDVGGWFGLLAPAKTPDAIITKIHDDMKDILSAPDVQAALAKDDYRVIGSSPQEFAAFLKKDVANVTDIMKDIKAH